MRIYSLTSQSVVRVAKRLQRDVLSVRENGTVTGKTAELQTLYQTDKVRWELTQRETLGINLLASLKL